MKTWETIIRDMKQNNTLLNLKKLHKNLYNHLGKYLEYNVTQFRQITLVAHLQTLNYYSAILYKKPIKFGIKEDQLMLLLDTIFSLQPNKMAK